MSLYSRVVTRNFYLGAAHCAKISLYKIYRNIWYRPPGPTLVTALYTRLNIHCTIEPHRTYTSIFSLFVYDMKFSEMAASCIQAHIFGHLSTGVWSRATPLRATDCDCRRNSHQS